MLSVDRRMIGGDCRWVVVVLFSLFIVLLYVGDADVG